MKAILVIDMPTVCVECPLCSDGHCDVLGVDLEDVFNQKHERCPLSHPLKRVSNDFYIYDTRYLFDHLDRERELMRSAKDFVKEGRNRMTERQRDIYTIYCLLEGIQTKYEIKEQMEDFLRIRQIIADICVERANNDEQEKDSK